MSDRPTFGGHSYQQSAAKFHVFRSSLSWLRWKVWLRAGEDIQLIRFLGGGIAVVRGRGVGRGREGLRDEDCWTCWVIIIINVKKHLKEGLSVNL